MISAKNDEAPDQQIRRFRSEVEPHDSDCGSDYEDRYHDCRRRCDPSNRSPNNTGL